MVSSTWNTLAVFAPLISICWRAHRRNLERVGATERVTGQTTKRLSHSFRPIRFVTAKSLAALCYPVASQRSVKTAKIEANKRCPPFQPLCLSMKVPIKLSISSLVSHTLQLISCGLLLCRSPVSIKRANVCQCTEMFRLNPVLLISLSNWFGLINWNLHTYSSTAERCQLTAVVLCNVQSSSILTCAPPQRLYREFVQRKKKKQDTQPKLIERFIPSL